MSVSRSLYHWNGYFQLTFNTPAHPGLIYARLARVSLLHNQLEIFLRTQLPDEINENYENKEHIKSSGEFMLLMLRQQFAVRAYYFFMLYFNRPPIQNTAKIIHNDTLCTDNYQCNDTLCTDNHLCNDIIFWFRCTLHNVYIFHL